MAQSREPEVEAILPLGERALRLDEKYTLLAAVHDSELQGVAKIALWPDSNLREAVLEALPYKDLLGKLPHGIKDAKVELHGFLEDVRQDAERARQEPKGAGPAQEIVKICDEMLHLGREGDAKTGTAVGEYQPRSGPSGILGRMGQARDAEWQALSAKFDSRAERLADLVKVLDPAYDTGTFYSPAPVSVYVAYPKARKMLSEDERLWLREKDLADGKTEAEADAFLAQLDALQKARTRNMWTKMQWPGYVVDVPGHRRFLSPPELVHPFDRRFNTLKNWAAERARRERDTKPPHGEENNYLPASQVQATLRLTYKELMGLLDKCPEIHRFKPSKQRLMVHVGDIIAWKAAQDKREVEVFDALDAADRPAEEIADEFAMRIEKRKAAADEKKRKEKASRED